MCCRGGGGAGAERAPPPPPLHRPRPHTPSAPARAPLQVGQAGNQLGGRFWELALAEHAAANPGGLFDAPLSSLFRHVDGGGGELPRARVGRAPQPLAHLRARAVVVDMECGVVGSLMRVSVGGWQGVRAGARAGNRGGVAARRSPAVEPPTSLCRSPPPSATSAATFPIRRAPFASSLMRGSS